jgi:putative heme-binding domain-containing protein
MNLRTLGVLLAAASCSLRAAQPISLFDGKSLAGWEGDLKWWSVEDGAIAGGSTTEKVPRNFFLATERSFQNFELRLKIKLTGDPKTGMINSGVQIRSLRVPNDTEMSGYQVDAGDGWWGKLYDESRRNKVIAVPADPNAGENAVKKGEWNEYRIRAEGPRIRAWINGVATVDYTEAEPNIAQDGKVALQIHSGGIARVQFKDLTIEELPPTPGAPTWDKVGHPKPRDPNAKKKAAPKKAAEDTRNPNSAAAAKSAGGGRDLSYNAVTTGARSPEEERRSFVLPAGFEAELVAAESDGLGKFVGLAFDARMRLWTMTALEYPVDGNEQKSASDALFAAGGRDKVVVFDNVFGSDVGTAAKPRVFADGLVMPLGVQPWRDGALVQYGADIRFYRDADGDGRAERHEVVLTGFGTQDSHLFPHQFLRQPGGTMFVAQGLFNYSTVRRPGGAVFADGTTEVTFNQCKLAVMALDGSRFENVTAGPNNIWGLLTSREGETFLQEANDIGYPVIPYAPGIWVATGSRERLRPYQPLMPPPLGPAQMGGTGLSGLALAEDRDSPFMTFPSPNSHLPSSKIFFLANPITNTINAVRATPTADGARYTYEKLPDFLTTDDKWFRPVAIHFGPDGALYLVDWYNKIISHNEVPRAHPDRDKTRGRIWRIRHREQQRVVPPDLTKLDDRTLLAQLGGPNALVSRLAWLEIGDRRAATLAPDLAKLAGDSALAKDYRLGALWALESLQAVPTALLVRLAADPAATVRKEAVRLAAAFRRSEAEFLSIATPLVSDPAPAVRAALGDALRRVPRASAKVMLLAAKLGGESLAADTATWPRYEREFERYLARWALELNPAATAALLASSDGRALPLENRILATLALGGKDAALGLTRLAAGLKRPLGDEEVRALAAHFAEPAVRSTLATALATPSGRVAVLRALLAFRHSMDATPLSAALASAARLQLASATPADQLLGAEVAGAFKLAALAPELTQTLESHWRQVKSPLALATLRALRETGAGPLPLLATIARESTEAPVRDEAVAALVASIAPEAPALLVGLLPDLPVAQRGRALNGLAGSPAGAKALVGGLRAGTVAQADIGLATLDRLHAVLPDDAYVATLWRKLGGDAASDTPPALTPAEAAAEAARFAHFRQLANARGNPEQGRELFTALCLNCHAFAGKGGQLAPPLDGVGNTGVEAILRNVLTPSAAMEGAYRTYRVTLHDGGIIDAFLVNESPDAVTVRIPGADERRIPRREIRNAGYIRRSLMPEGLLEALPPEQVSDLFAFLKSLR